jgi:hypothetical protein
MTTKHFPKGLDGRMRDQSGEIRQKRSDTQVGNYAKPTAMILPRVIGRMQRLAPCASAKALTAWTNC